MHELGGLICKTGNLWINGKIPGAEKKHMGAESGTGPTVGRKKNRGAGEASPSGLRPRLEEDAGRGGGAGWA